MAKIIKFRKRESHDPTTIKMVHIAAQIDQIILNCLENGDIDAKELAGILAHRLGTLMNHIDGKSDLWDVCQKVLKKQAHIE